MADREAGAARRTGTRSPVGVHTLSARPPLTVPVAVEHDRRHLATDVLPPVTKKVDTRPLITLTKNFNTQF